MKNNTIGCFLIGCGILCFLSYLKNEDLLLSFCTAWNIGLGIWWLTKKEN